MASGEKQLLTKLHREALSCGNSESMCTLQHIFSYLWSEYRRTVYTYIEPSTAASRFLDCFVLISAAHWCKEEFIKKKKKKKVKGSIR